MQLALCSSAVAFSFFSVLFLLVVRQAGEAASADPRAGLTADDRADLPLEPQGDPTALALSRPLDQGLVVRTREGWLLSGRSYRADVRAEGLRYVPTLVPLDRGVRGDAWGARALVALPGVE